MDSIDVVGIYFISVFFTLITLPFMAILTTILYAIFVKIKGEMRMIFPAIIAIICKYIYYFTIPFSEFEFRLSTLLAFLIIEIIATFAYLFSVYLIAKRNAKKQAELEKTD